MEEVSGRFEADRMTTSMRVGASVGPWTTMAVTEADGESFQTALEFVGFGQLETREGTPCLQRTLSGDRHRYGYDRSAVPDGLRNSRIQQDFRISGGNIRTCDVRVMSMKNAVFDDALKQRNLQIS